MTPWWSDREAGIERNRVQPEPDPPEPEPPPVERDDECCPVCQLPFCECGEQDA